MSEIQPVRSHLFLSHATPEDNDFTRWLAGKLILAGYKVWYDLDRLKGGDYFWNKIEHAIRNECIRMVAIVSESSYKKDGVRNEWDLGATIERQIPGFVIPIRVDDFDFSQLPITIHRKNVIDFHRGWHFGLSALRDTLEDAGVPTVANGDPKAAVEILPDLTQSAITWTDQKETLESNWVPLISLPAAIETTQILGNERQIKLTEANRQLPWFEYGEQIVGFAPRAELVGLFKDTTMLRALSAVDTESFLTGGITWGNNRVSVLDARNRIATLIRQAWDLRMERLGLKQYQLSNQRLVWFVPSGLIPKDKVEFTDIDGKRRRKQLVGSSAKFKVNWHYAVGVHPVLNETRRLELRAHIVFTDTNGQLIDSVARMHQLRRSFCKNWWNDRWRGFLRAFLAFVSQGEQTISLPVGGGRSIQIGALPITFVAPKGLSDFIELCEDDDIQIDDESSGLNEDDLLLDEEDQTA